MKKSVKRILAGLLSLCMAVSAWTPALSVKAAEVSEVATTETRLVNVAPDGTASTNDGDHEWNGIKYSIGNVNDGNTKTSWQTKGKWPSTATLDLKQERTVSKIEIELGEDGDYAPEKTILVTVSYASDGDPNNAIELGSQRMNVDSRATFQLENEQTFSATHVIVQLSPDGSTPAFWPSLQEIEVYEEQEVTVTPEATPEVTEEPLPEGALSQYGNIASVAMITATGNNEHPSDGSANLVDGGYGTLYKFYNDQMSSEQKVTLEFEHQRKIDAVRISFEHLNSASDADNYQYTYSIQARNGEGSYVVLADHKTANRLDNWQQSYKFEEGTYTEVQIIVHSCTTGAQNAGKGWPSIAEFEIFGSDAIITDTENIALGKSVHASSGQDTADKIVDGFKASQWVGADYPAYVDIDLKNNYLLDTVEIYTPANGYSQYSIYTSMDGRDFEKLAEKTDKTEVTLNSGEVYQAKQKEARIVRVYMEYNSVTTKAILNEVRVTGTLSENTTIQTARPINVVPFDEQSKYTLTVAPEDTYKEVYGIIERQLGDAYKEWFDLELAPSTNGYDYFDLSMKGNQVHVKGNDGVSLATGINHYLKYYCNVHISQVGKQVTMPASIPVIEGIVHRETKSEVRYSYNYCTLSYSMAFWGEPEWRNELDWLALNGVNVVLDATAQEEVWRRFLGELGYTHTEIKDFIAGPAYYAWAYMANLSGFGGPVHDSWFEERTELARKNQQIMRNLGMQPALQGYSGMVPVDIVEKAKNGYEVASNQVIAQGVWNQFQRPSMLVTTETIFDKYAALFYKCQEEVYGETSDYYATDPFHEGGETSTMSATDISRKVLTSMLAADSNAIWIIQAWQDNPTTGLLTGLDAVQNGSNHALVLDLYAEKKPKYGEKHNNVDEFHDTPWVFCMLNNFGGRLGLHGHLDNLAKNIPAAMNSSTHIKGIGITPEASGNNPVLYDFLFETIWQEDASQPMTEINLDTWLQKYTLRRYGAYSKEANNAWKILKDTVYNSKKQNADEGAPESIVNARPALSISAASTWGSSQICYDKVELEKAAKLLLADYEILKSSKAYLYDVATVLQQVLSNSAQEYHRMMAAAYNARNKEQFAKYAEEFLGIVTYMEKVTSTSEYYLLGTWVEQAKALGKNADDFSKDLYEMNAKALITTWGSKNHADGLKPLKDYSNRQWSGLLNDFYKVRWQRWIDERTKELNGVNYDNDINWFEWEWSWVRGNTVYTTVPKTQEEVNLAEVGEEILETYSVDDGASDASRDLDVKKITTVEAGNYQKDNATEGNPNYVLDGDTGTHWHTEFQKQTPVADQYIIFTFDEVQTIDGMRFLQRQNGSNGVVTQYSLYVREKDTDEWVPVVVNATMLTHTQWQKTVFTDEAGNPKAVNAKQVKFQVEASSSDSSGNYAAAAEIRFTEPQLGDSEEKDITIKVGETIQIFDWSGIYDESGRAELNENIAGVVVTDSKVINEEKANLFDKKSNDNEAGIDRYRDNLINVSECLYKFELIDGKRYYISGTTASEETVYLNPNEGSVHGYPNRADKEAVVVESGTTADGGIGFKFKDSEEKDPNGNNYYLQFVNDWCLFNEYPLDNNGNLHNQFVTVVFKLYELVEDQNTGVYNYQLVTQVQDGGQYAIVADYDYNKDGTNDTEFLLRPSSNVDTADTKSRNDHAAKIATDIGDTSNTVLTTRNEVRITGVSKGRTEITVGNTTYNIFVIQEEHEIELMEGKTIVLSGTTLKVGPNTEFATIKELQEGGFLITAVNPGTTDVEIDNVLYHITVLKKEVGSEIGTSNGHKVTRLKMTADRTFNLNVINTELTNVKWSVINSDGTGEVDWATIDQNGVVSATPKGKEITTGKEGFIIAEVYDDNGNFVERIEIEFRLNPQPADLNNVRLYDIYIDDLHHTDLYYGWIYAVGSQPVTYENSPELVKAVEGEVFYISMDSKTGNALDFFAKPENGYALTQMNATDTLGHYKKLEGATASDTEFMQPGIAGDNQAKFARNEVLALVDMARALGCHGAQGFTTLDKPTVLTYRSEQLPTVKKTVNGAWNKETGYREYQKDMKINIGDYVFFNVTVDTYACKDLITYSDVKLKEMLEGAIFIQGAPDENINPTTLTGLETIDITDDIDGDKLIAGTHTYYAMYQIQPEDVADALHTVKNTVALGYNYKSQYSTSAFAGTANGEASVIVENIPLKSIVVDFGLPVEYIVETGEEYQPLANVKTMYGVVNVTSTPNAEKEGIFDNKVNYTPTKTLQGADVIVFTPVDSEKETKVVMVYPATTVYYEEGFATYTGDWGKDVSKGTGKQAHRYLETMDNLDQYGYDAKYAQEQPGPSNVTQAISSKSGNTATFKFTGTGTDIYANCSPATGNVTIFVRAINPDGSAGAIKKLMMINTKMEVGKSELTEGQSVTAYNMLLASVSGLEHGTYSVEIIHGTTMVEQNKLDANNNPIIDSEGNPVKEKVPKSKTISLDGFRVYNTLENSGIFNVHYENYPNFVEMRNVVLNSIVPETLLNKDGASTETSIYAEDIANKLTQVLDPNEKAGAMILLAGNSSYTDADVKDLLDNGPKNELFLYEGQALTFRLAAGLQNVQIGMKAVNSGAKVTLVNGKNSKSWNMTTSTDMFYTIGHMDEDTTIVIQNVSDEDAKTNNILSITDLKYFVPQTMSNDVFAPMTADAFATALLSMGYEAKPTPEVTEEVTPEPTPEVTEEVTPEPTPEVTEEVTPEATPEVTEEVTPEATPEVTEEVTPEETPEATPEVTEEVTPEETPIVTPEVTEEVTVEVNKSKLESLVNGAITDGSKFTEESWKVFAEALEVARAVVEKEDATQEEVDAAYKALFSAAFELVNKPVVPEVTPEVTPEETPGVTPEEVCKVFEDVKHEAWYEVGVQYVYDSGLMNGSDGKFNPTADITRAQLVTTLYRHAGSPEVTDTKALTDFSDVVEEKYYTDAVCWAYAEGIATGNDGKFDPNGQLTRQQMAAFFYRYAKCQGEDVTVKADISEMVGADKVSGYAKEAVEWAVGAGLISGSETTDANGNVIKDLNPRGNTTRAQVAMILQRFCEN